jgi:hypothetical protein
MSNAAQSKLKVVPSSDQNVKNIESERSSLDSYHDNPSSRKHPIINNLYNNKTSYTDEDEFVKDINTKIIPDEYYINRDLRLEKRLRGFFTTRMECLVNKTPLHFKNSPNTSLTFVYDQGPHPINYFENAVNGMFISDAVDTAPKLTNPSQRPVLFKTPKDEIVVPGSYIGFNENIVRTVIFSDFSSVSDKVQCKVIIEARLNEQSPYRWFDLSQKFEETGNRLIGYTLPEDARRNANFKKSNEKNTGFFIGNANAKKLLENKELKPILALCLVVAKILGDFSSALASSPRNIPTYTAKKTYGKSEQIDIPEMIIHASGDRLCSLEASRQGANSIKTSPRNSDGIIPIQYTPGVKSNEPIDYKQRFNIIYTEITKRFDDLLVDLNAFSVYKYKVDGGVVSPEKVENLQNYVKTLISKIEISKGLVEDYINTIAGKDDENYRLKYETLYRQKIALMPQAPLISTSTKDGYRKNLNSKFHIYKLPDSKLSIDLRGEVYEFMRSNIGGKRKSLSKRLRRTPRRIRGGQKSTKEEALADFDKFINDIQDKIFNFVDNTKVIEYDSKKDNDPFGLIIVFIEKNYISTDTFIDLVKQNRHKITDPKEIEWAKEFAVKDEDEDEEPLAKIPKLDEQIYVPDYDEEFMEELEEATKKYEEETEDPDTILLIQSITFDESEPPTDAIMSDDEKSTSSLTDNAMTDDEKSAKKKDVPSTPTSRASTPNSEPQTLPIDRSRTGSDTESSQNAGRKRKRKTYRRIRLF